jgi:starch synthase
MLPLYRGTRTAKVPPQPTEHTLRVPVGAKTYLGRLWKSRLPDSDVPVYLIEQEEFFDRDGLYQFTAPDGSRHDYGDNCARFVFFNRAVLEAIRLLRFWPDVLHANDWQTGLLPVLLREDYNRFRDLDIADRYRRVRTLFTVHNLAYQGSFWPQNMPLTGLSWCLFNFLQLEAYGNLNFLKGGLVFADHLSTVSPTYAKEIQTPYYGYGLQGVLYERRDRLTGIVNGVDYQVWDPSIDRHLSAKYTADAVQPGKGKCKAALQEHFQLAIEPGSPLLGVVARLAEQKGIDLILGAAPALLRDGAQLVVLGDGDPHHQQRLRQLAAEFPGRVGLLLGFSEPLAHRIEAGADIFLMPSLYEPSGLNQLYSMRYGTPPVVRATGGLADTVTDTTPQTLADGTATGFRFVAYNTGAFLETVRRAISLYRGQPEAWRNVVTTAMRQDWSWDRSAAEYERLYQRILTEK